MGVLLHRHDLVRPRWGDTVQCRTMPFSRTMPCRNGLGLSLFDHPNLAYDHQRTRFIVPDHCCRSMSGRLRHWLCSDIRQLLEQSVPERWRLYQRAWRDIGFRLLHLRLSHCSCAAQQGTTLARSDKSARAHRGHIHTYASKGRRPCMHARNRQRLGARSEAYNTESVFVLFGLSFCRVHCS